MFRIILQCVWIYDASLYYGTQKLTSEPWTPSYTSLQHNKDKKNIGQTVSLMAVVCVLKNVLKNNRSGNDLMSQQENWAIKENPKTTLLTPIEKLHSRSRTSTMCTFGKKKNACVHVHSEFQLMKWLLRVWPLSVSSDGCYHCFFFICFEWKPVIRLGWVASYMVLPEQMYDFSFVCERGRVYVSDTEKTSNRSCGPCQLAAQFCVMQENTQSFHLDRE